MRRALNASMRAQNQATETVSDVFGRQIPAYAGIPIGVIEEDAEGNPILGFDEEDDTTSISAWVPGGYQNKKHLRLFIISACNSWSR